MINRQFFVTVRPIGFLSLIGSIVFGFTTTSSAQIPQDASHSSTGWLRFDGCPVLQERAIDVPALESGLLESVDVELNSEVTEGTVAGRLNSDLATMELRLAQLQSEAADSLVKDNSDVEYHQLALQEVEDELKSFQSIESSVSSAEIRRLTLNVGKAKLALIRSRRAKTRAGVEAQLKAAAVEAAEKRLKRRVISIPSNGVVTTVHRHRGQWVQAGDPVIEVVQMDHLVVDCLLPEQQVDRATIIGAEVRVEIPPSAGSNPNEPTVKLSGRITSYDPKVSSAGFVRVHARIANVKKDGQWVLLPGRVVNLFIPSRHFSGVDNSRSARQTGNSGLPR